MIFLSAYLSTFWRLPRIFCLSNPKLKVPSRNFKKEHYTLKIATARSTFTAHLFHYATVYNRFRVLVPVVHLSWLKILKTHRTIMLIETCNVWIYRVFNTNSAPPLWRKVDLVSKIDIFLKSPKIYTFPLKIFTIMSSSSKKMRNMKKKKHRRKKVQKSLGMLLVITVKIARKSQF